MVSWNKTNVQSFVSISHETLSSVYIFGEDRSPRASHTLIVYFKTTAGLVRISSDTLTLPLVLTTDSSQIICRCQ